MAGFMSINANNKSYQMLMDNYNVLLNLPLSTRCGQLSSLLLNSALKDLKELYGLLVEEIFGFRNKHDWDLLSLDNYDTSDFQAVKSFLAPEGILLQLAYKLSEDAHLRYSFPISCLPTPTSQALHQGKISDFYAHKISYSPDRQLSAFLQLNAFEFFLYHFSYFVVNSHATAKLIIANSKPQDTLYESLLEEFLCYFLPKDSISVPSCPTSLISPPSPCKTHSPPSSFKTSPNKPGWNVTSPSKPSSATGFLASTPKQKPHVLKLSAILGGNSLPNNGAELPHSSAESGIYQSELFVEIITEMYLSPYMNEKPYSHFSPFIETYVPNHHHVWTIRVLIKHFHCFTNTSFFEQHDLRLPNSIIDPFSNLKSYLLSKYVQKKLFTFLKMIFQHWPLDETFRAPLETWLSYIQPWRYAPRSIEDSNFVSRWQKFVTANLLFYTPFLTQVLLRLFRMDLTTVKNAYMLYRVTKVFYQEHLDTMIIEAEKSFGINSASSPNLKGLHSLDTLSPTHTSTFQTTFQNMEFSLNNYVPLFSMELTSQVYRLLVEIYSAQERVPQAPNLNDSTFFSQVSSWFDDRSPNMKDPLIGVEKLNLLLEYSASNLCTLFKIEDKSIQTQKPNILHTSHRLSNTSMDENQNDQFISLIKQLNSDFKQKVIFEGNPDTQRVRTYEIESLVKAYGELSDFLNLKYAQEINELYYRPTLLGRICRQVFAAPTVYKDIVKSTNLSDIQQKDVQLPPRIVLRPLASKYVIGRKLLFLWLLYYFFSLHPILCILLLILLRLLIIFLKAVFSN